MVRFLKLARERKATSADADNLLAMNGTKLVIQQQNISRRVDMQQYQELLHAMVEGRAPTVSPVNDDARSGNGVKGLLQDVWPSLVWGMKHTDVLALRLAEVRKMDISRRAKAIALANLPETVEFTPRLNLVMGGRAGAATLPGEILFDVLIKSFRADNGSGTYPKPEEIVEFFAHEMHHIGLGEILDSRRKLLRLDESQAHGFLLLSALVSEGSATFLINAHGTLDVMRKDPQYGRAFQQQPELLRTIQHILSEAMSGELNAATYDEQVAAFLGSGYHVTGAVLLNTIVRGSGKKALWAVMRDPRQLLLQYNRAAEKIGSKRESDWSFDPALAKVIAAMGQ
jgi:hypothetical protein